MNKDEAALIRFTQDWERRRRSRELAGTETDDEDTAPQPLSKTELRNLLKRDRAPKKGDQ